MWKMLSSQAVSNWIAVLALIIALVTLVTDQRRAAQAAERARRDQIHKEAAFIGAALQLIEGAESVVRQWATKDYPINFQPHVGETLELLIRDLSSFSDVLGNLRLLAPAEVQIAFNISRAFLVLTAIREATGRSMGVAAMVALLDASAESLEESGRQLKKLLEKKLRQKNRERPAWNKTMARRLYRGVVNPIRPGKQRSRTGN